MEVESNVFVRRQLILSICIEREGFRVGFYHQMRRWSLGQWIKVSEIIALHCHCSPLIE